MIINKNNDDNNNNNGNKDDDNNKNNDDDDNHDELGTCRTSLVSSEQSVLCIRKVYQLDSLDNHAMQHH